MNIQPITPAHRPAINEYIRNEWSGPLVVTKGRVVDTTHAAGFTADEDGVLCGAVLYEILGETCEVLVLFSLHPGKGAGGALLKAVLQTAQSAGCKRVFLVTTNDNIGAIRFYQRQGWDLCGLYLNTLDETRIIKPNVPLLGEEDIPLRHELEFEYLL